MQQPPAEKVEHVWETVTISSESSSTTPACTSMTLTSIFYLGCLPYWEFSCWSVIINVLLIHVLIIHVLSIHVLLFVAVHVLSYAVIFLCFSINYRRVKVSFSFLFFVGSKHFFYCNSYSLYRFTYA